MTTIIDTGKNINERKLVAPDVLESEHRLADIVNFLPDATFVIDQGGKVIAWNPAMEEMTGVRVEEVVGKGDHAYAIPFYGTRRPLLIDLALREDETIEAGYAVFKRFCDRGVIAEVYIPTLKKGTHLSGTARALRNTNGEIVGAIESIRDITERKRLEETLRESEKSYREMFENSIDGWFQSSPEGRYLNVNPAFARMAGYDSPDQMIREITDIARQYYVYPEKRALGKEIYEKKGYSRTSNMQFRRKDGSIFWGSVAARAVRDETGKIVRYEGIVSDITERKRAEEALRTSEASYRAIFNAANDAIFIHDLDTGAILDVNRRMSEMFGFSREEILNHDVGILSSGEAPYTEGNAREWMRKAREGEPQIFEWHCKHKNGNLFWGEVNLKWTVIGGKERLLAVVRDITGRKQAEEVIRNSERRMADIINFLPDATFVIDTKGTVIAWNHAMENLTGVMAENILMKGDYEYALPFYGQRRPILVDLALRADENIERLYSNIEKENETLTSETYTPLLKGGVYLWFKARPLYDSNGNVVGAIESIRDITARRLATKAVRESEERFNLFMDHFPGVVFIKDLEGRYVYINRYYEQHRDRRREEVYGRTDLELWPVETAVMFQEADRRVMTEGISMEMVETIRQTDGTENIQRTIKFPLLKDGRPTFLAGFGLDIGRQMKAEEELRESEERYRRLHESITDAVVTTDLKGRIHDFNRVYQKMMGYSGEELKQTTYTDLTPEKWWFLETTIIQEQVLARGYSDVYEKEYRRKDGTVFPVELRTFLIRDKSAEPVGMWAIVRDITERKAAEHALRESEEKYRMVVEHANDAVFIAQDSVIRFLTARLSEITGYSAQEIQVKHISDLIAPEDRDWVFERYQRRLKGEEVPTPYEFRILTSTGKVRWVDINAVLIEWEGRPATLNFLRDITARRQMEAALVHAQKMEAVGTLAGGVAHDFNNLLQGILGYSELLLLNKATEEKGGRELREILHAAGRGAELARQLLTFSRKVESRLKPVDLNREVLNVAQLLQRTIPKMIEIELRLAPGLRRVNADANQIEQVLMNLAVNAKDAMPDGGRLTIETANVTLDEEYCRSHLGAVPGEHLLLSVTDNGCGMTKETLDHIFEPFYTTKGVGKGTGLGLAMVYGIVKSHNGYIMCYSEIGSGTTFKIYLPAVMAAAEQVEEKKEAPLRGGTETILLVDDEESIRTAGEAILSRFGYRVLTAANGETALEIYRGNRERIDLIILDLIMPGMGGRKCLEKILEFDPEAKVLIASGYGATGPIRETMDAGARGFISKPYHMRNILNTVRNILD